MYVTKHECANDSFPKHMRQVFCPLLGFELWLHCVPSTNYMCSLKLPCFITSFTMLLVLYQIPLPVFTLHHSLNKLILHPGQHSSFFSEEKRRAALDGIWTYNTLLSRRVLYIPTELATRATQMVGVQTTQRQTSTHCAMAQYTLIHWNTNFAYHLRTCLLPPTEWWSSA